MKLYGSDGSPLFLNQPISQIHEVKGGVSKEDTRIILVYSFMIKVIRLGITPKDLSAVLIPESLGTISRTLYETGLQTLIVSTCLSNHVYVDLKPMFISQGGDNISLNVQLIGTKAFQVEQDVFGTCMLNR